MKKDEEELINESPKDEIVEKQIVEESAKEEITEDFEQKQENEEKETDLEATEVEEKEETEIVVEEKTETIVQDKKEKTKAIKKSKGKIIFITIIVIAVLLFLSTIFAIINMNNTKIIKGVNVEGIDVSNLTAEEAMNKVKEKVEIIQKRDITLVYNDYSTTITPEQIEMSINFDNAISQAKSLGKTNNIIVDNYSILKANLFKTNFGAEINYNEEILLDIIANINLELPGAVKKVDYEIDDDKLIITKGQPGISIKNEELEEAIIKNIEKQLKDVIDDVEIPVQEVPEEKIDIEKIYKEVYKEPKDAYIEEEPFKLHVEENGLDFKITIEEAQEIVNKDQDTYEIPLKITKPKVKTADLGDKIFKQTLSKYTTIYDAGNRSRSTNIAIAARTINGKIILPGETFSYNKVLGNTTKEKGYQLGTAYVGGKVVPAYGGGICQVSTTLYNAVLYANLGIVERYNHSYAVSYVPAGRDATVAYGGKDFKFKNTRKYPVKIVASAKNGVVSVALVGIKEEKEYEIVLKSSVIGTTPYKVVYQDNSSLPEGKEKVIQKGYTGYKSKAYKTVKYNGKVISTTLLSADTYQPMNRIIERGTKKSKPDTKPIESKTEEKPIESIPDNIG